jgi:phage-related protein
MNFAFRDKAGIYRVIYYLAGAGNIWLLHAFKKKTQATPKQNIDVTKERIQRILK